MKTAIVIPARYASSRYPGKPLVELTGATGEARSLVLRSWDAAMAVTGVSSVAIATDDARIRDHAEAAGATVIMTGEACANGTERCADTLGALDPDVDLVVNLQGDAPLTPPWFVEALMSAMETSTTSVATPVLRCDGEALNGFLEDRRSGRVGGTTAVFDTQMRALYFSKEVIPFTSEHYANDASTPVFHHVGVYAYRRDALARYATFTPGPLEGLEGLEQLRFMEHGEPIQCVEVDGRGVAFWELNNPSDVEKIEEYLQRANQK